jgi:pimeloyl-ACP methyl ester carboxylesterase
VLDAGLNAAADSWALVQPAVARFTCVCSYDRVGAGQSDVDPQPRTCRDFAADLHAVLVAAGEVGPFVLVGHSFGGLVARVYADAYPQDLTGLVLVDSPHPDYPRRALDLLPLSRPDEHPEIAESRVVFTQMTESIDGPTADPGQVRWATSLAQVRASRLPPDLPLHVVSAGQPGDYPEGFPADLAAQIDALGRELQRELLRLSNRSALLVAERSGHLTPRDQPERDPPPALAAGG